MDYHTHARNKMHGFAKFGTVVQSRTTHAKFLKITFTLRINAAQDKQSQRACWPCLSVGGCLPWLFRDPKTCSEVFQPHRSVDLGEDNRSSFDIIVKTVEKMQQLVGPVYVYEGKNVFSELMKTVD